MSETTSHVDSGSAGERFRVVSSEQSEEGGPLGDAEPLGETAYSRRLSDKILSAFNHAYALGEADIAGHLRNALQACAELERNVGGTRAQVRALDQADMWVNYVDARDAFNAVKRRREGNADQALTRMREAYRRWSNS